MRKSAANISIFMTIFIVLLIAGYSYFKWEIEPEKGFLELSQADVWGDLQGVEFRHRTDHLPVPMILKAAVGPDKYDVLAVASNSKQFPYVWIVLNVNAGMNGLFTMPDHVAYSLQCDYLEKLKTQVKIDVRVLNDLSHHCLN